jgi:hypothetical protein
MHANNKYAFSPVDLSHVSLFLQPLCDQQPALKSSDNTILPLDATQGSAPLGVCTEKKENWWVLSTLSTQAHRSWDWRQERQRRGQLRAELPSCHVIPVLSYIHCMMYEQWLHSPGQFTLL